jgi:hypothetical protein
LNLQYKALNDSFTDLESDEANIIGSPDINEAIVNKYSTKGRTLVAMIQGITIPTVISGGSRKVRKFRPLRNTRKMNLKNLI